MILKSLFWQLVNSIIKIFLEIFVIDRKIRRILKGNWAKFYLRKYVNKGCKNCPLTPTLSRREREKSNSQEEGMRPIWQYWESKDGIVPPLVQACLNSVDKFKGNRKRIMLTPENVRKYVEIPEIFLELKEKGIIKTAFFSDILRTCLLIRHGGIWIDATVLLTEELPDYITDADLFVFQNDLKIDLDGLNMASYFIAAKPDNIILKQTLEALKYDVLRFNDMPDYSDVKVKIIHGGVGAINESDVMLAKTTGAIIFGFGVRPDSNAKSVAEAQ